MGRNWTSEARDRLLSLRREGRAWGYAPRTALAVEPTALAGLALWPDDPDASRAAADWLATMRAADGSLGMTGSLNSPCWATPFASLLWGTTGGRAEDRTAAVAWILQARGEPVPRTKGDPIGHDSTIIGWPWVSGTHSWVEPTAIALLALAREGRLGHPRAVEGLALIRDRAIRTGGWNLGNPVVFDTVMRPLPGPTGLALLALAAARQGRGSAVSPAVGYLRSILPGTKAPSSLAWGLLGLGAWGERPEGAEGWLGESFEALVRRGATAMSLALLILAAGGGIDRLGVESRAGRPEDD